MFLVKELTEFIKSVIIALVMALLIITFIFQTVSVDGSSMFPTLKNKDRLILEKVTYYFRKPKIGDIVVFKYPSDKTQKFIKRVIGTEGDTIKILDHKVYVNDKQLEETGYIYEEMASPNDINFKDGVKVPKGTIFVLGDNRNNSRDSRFSDVGFIPLKLVLGRAVFRLFPFTSFGKVG